MGTSLLETQWISTKLSGECDDVSFGWSLWVQHSCLLQRSTGSFAAIDQYCL